MTARADGPRFHARPQPAAATPHQSVINMALNKSERAVIEKAIARLNPETTTASREVAK